MYGAGVQRGYARKGSIIVYIDRNVNRGTGKGGVAMVRARTRVKPIHEAQKR
jgi:hypothetical protein